MLNDNSMINSMVKNVTQCMHLTGEEETLGYWSCLNYCSAGVRDIMTKATYIRKHLIGDLFTFQKGQFMIVLVGQYDSTRVVAGSLTIACPQYECRKREREKKMKEEKEEKGGGGGGERMNLGLMQASEISKFTPMTHLL